MKRFASSLAITLVLIPILPGCTWFYRPTDLQLSIPSSKLAEFQYCSLHPLGQCGQSSRAFEIDAGQAPIATLPIMEAGSASAWRAPNFRNQNNRAAGDSSSASRALRSSVETARRELNEEFDKFANHPITRTAESLRSTLKNGQPQQVTEPGTIKVSEVRGYIQLVTSITDRDGWAVAREDAAIDTPEGQARSVYAAYLEVYTKAYFRNGEFGRVKFELTEFYKRNPELEKYKNELDPVLKRITDQGTFGKIGQTAFVSRVGRQLQFPPLEVTVDPSKHTAVSVAKVDYAEVGADVVRLVVEAIADARDRLPAVSNATGASKANFQSNEATYALQEFAPAPEGKPIAQGSLTSAQFTQTTSLANSADGAAGSATGQFIRGLNIVALNNEALAKAIEALVGTIVRKATEKASYCWYACVVNGTHTRTLAGPQNELSATVPSDATATAQVRFQ